MGHSFFLTLSLTLSIISLKLTLKSVVYSSIAKRRYETKTQTLVRKQIHLHLNPV